MAAAEVDVGRVAGHLGLPEATVQSVAAEPTAELVASLLQAVISKAGEYDDLYNAKLMLDVELESAHRNSEEKCRSAKATADKALKDVEEARQKLREEETKRQEVENELQSLKTRGSDHDSEITALRDRIESLQSSNRANMALLESRNTRDSEVAEELSKQHQKNVQLNKEIMTLQQSLQAAQATVSGAKYREESLQQQLELAKRNSDWFENELKTKSEEALKYRKEKGTRLAELQRQNDDAKSELDSLKRSEQQLRTRLDAAQSKAEEALTKIQQQQEAFARTEESYKHELENKQRLVDMSNALTESHKSRVHQLENERDALNQKHANDIKRLQLELEREKENGRALEERVGQLEAEIDELQVRMERAPPAADSVPSTPRPNGSLIGRAGSPFATPGSIRGKSAITATQAIDELYKVKAQLAGEKRRSQQLGEELDDMIAVLEAKRPEFEESQAEVDRLRAEITKMSQLMEHSYEERDGAKKSARKAEGALAKAQAEAKIQRTQIRDLSIQIQMLLFNMHAQEKGVDQLTREETLRLEQLSRGETTEDALSDMSDTHQFITQKFVVYKDIRELQEKNQELLRVTRDLAEKMESEEAVAAKNQAVQDHDTVEKMERELANMIDEAKSLKTTMESYKSERDMFRRLLQQKASAGELASILGSSDDNGERLPLTSIETEQGDNVSPQAALRDLQVQFDSYRDDAESVRQSLRDQVDKISSEKNGLHSEVAKITSQLSLASERYDMLHSNFVALQQENKELQKRSQSLSETAAKQDIRTQQVVEELVEARGLVESMRNESANLKAEKELWKTIHDRLNKDNEGLVEEKARLNNLLATQQSLQNERDITDAEARRKAQTKIDSLETELADTKRKLSEEAEEGKKLQLRKEFDARESQKRIDELSANLSQIREEHVAVKTSRDHLQSRVDELTIELRSAEERYGRLQPRPTPRPGTAADPSQGEQDETELHELINEVADLKRDLELSKTHLENAKEQAEQYKQLSEQNEEALSDFTSSQEQYREEMDSIVNAKDAKIKELEQRIEDLSAELGNSNKELSNLRDTQGEVARRAEDEKHILQEEVTRLKEEADRYSEAAKFHQADLRAQLELTNQAQQDYEQELVKHADAAKQAQQLRADYNELKNQSAALRAEAEAAKVTLTQSQGSWEDRRQQLEQEISELKARRDDTNAQNKLLHQQLESITSQFASLKQNRTATDPNEAVADAASLGGAADGLRELNSYLQREKDILEVQYDLKVQEANRLQQQLNYAHSQLEEARVKLDQERRAHADSSQGSLGHKDLMEKLHELNLYRESSATLRNELTLARAQITEKTTKIEELEGKVQPLEAKIEEIQTHKGFMEEELKQIQEDRDRWQKRTEGILTKYGRVDPAEMEQLKQTIAELEQERDALKEAEGPLKTQLEESQAAVNTEKQARETLKARLTEQFKGRSKQMSAEKNQLIAEKKELEEQLAKANAELEDAKKGLESSNAANSSSSEQVPELQQQIATLTSQLEEVQQQLQSSSTQNTEYAQQVQEFQQEVQRLQQQLQAGQAPDQPMADASAATTEAATEATPQTAPQETSDSAPSPVVSQLQQQISQLQQELDAMSTAKAGLEEELENVRSQLQSITAERDEAVKKAEALEQASQQATTTAVDNTAQQAPALSDEERTALQEKVATAEARVAEVETKIQDIENNMTQTLKERSDKMRNALNDKLRQEKAKLNQDFQTKLEQEKIIWQAENSTAAAAPPTQDPVPSTPVKQQPDQAPATPTTGTPGTGFDPATLPDGDVRKLLANNPTAKNIFTANLKKKVEEQTVKAEANLRAEYEKKLVTAREEGQMLASKKSALQLSMKDNQVKGAKAKLDVVQQAAETTPERAVGEVWEEAKNAKPPPAAPPAQGTPARAPVAAQPGTPNNAAATPAPAASAQPAGKRPPPSVFPIMRLPTTAPVPAPATAAPAQAPATPATSTTAPTANAGADKQGDAASAAPANPFAAAAANAPSTGNPFAQAAAAQQQPAQKPAQPQQQAPQQGQPNVRSSIPVPGRGGAATRGRGGAYQPPASRIPGGAERGGHAGRGRGRGGHAQANMNPGAADFQPGNKRPRGDSEIGGGAKRARGNH